MEKFRKYGLIIIVLVGLIVYSYTIVYYLEKEKKACSNIVILNTGDTIRAWAVHPNNHGMIEINKCSGESVTIPNFRIKEMKLK
jgi:hypothetical protein